MAIKVVELFSFIFLLLVVLFAIGLVKRDIPTDKKSSSSSFEFINLLKDGRKGDNIEGIHQLKAYLQNFGYLDQTHTKNDDFNDALESAIKTYQQNFHIKPTGILDAATVSKMTAPRCGAPDIINGINYMQPRKKKHDSSSSTIHTVSHYTFFPGSPRWPSDKTDLTYSFSPNVPPKAKDPIASAFQIWASATQFNFSEVEDVTASREVADILIGFYKGDHGDGGPFDGPGGILAHSFHPNGDGRFHFDADEQWAVGAVPGKIDLESVAVHEIGHLLGLGHSQVKDSIMYPTMGPGVVKLTLQSDDLAGIQALYSDGTGRGRTEGRLVGMCFYPKGLG